MASAPASEVYDFSAVAEKWRDRWRDTDQFATPSPDPERTDSYVFVALPFTSGEIHMGHVRSYSIADADARFRRACGEAVLFSLGFDAFGLPAEIGAIEHEVSPAEWVEHCRADMRQQLDRLGFSFDWSRTFATSEPDVYQWSQRLFIQLYEAELVYRKDGFAHWCDACCTVLAAIQVENERCWRCEAEVRLVRKPQWFIRLSAYNEENERRLSELTDWDRAAIAAQRTLLGRVEGVEFEAYSPTGTPLTVFTPFPDSIGDGAFVAMSPFHPELDAWVSGGSGQLDFGGGTQGARGLDRLPVRETGSFVHISGISKPLPVIVSPAVEARFGSTAVLGIPSESSDDEAIAAKLPENPQVAWSIKKPLVKQPAVRYRASDFSISRQRAWGAPVPIVHCEACGSVPVPADQLPVRLPADLVVDGKGNALDAHESFAPCKCPTCGAEARRDTDTLDCHVDVSWIYMAPAVPPADRQEEMFGHPDLRRWLPAKQIVNGADNGGFVLDERMVAKALRDLELIDFSTTGEPYLGAVMHEMVQMDGRKMSKHLGNVVSPKELLEAFGADALRLAVLYAAAPEKSFNWNPSVLRHCSNFLLRLWEYAEPKLDSLSADSHPLEIDTTSHLRRRLDSWCETATRRVTENFAAVEPHRAVRNVMTLFDRIVDFERKVIEANSELNDRDEEAMAFALCRLAQLLAPLAPHIAEELWELAGHDDTLSQAQWPIEIAQSVS